MILAFLGLMAGCVTKEEIEKPDAQVSFQVSGSEVYILEFQTNYGNEKEELFIQKFKEGFEDRLNKRTSKDREDDTFAKSSYNTGYAAALSTFRATEGKDPDGKYRIRKFPRDPNSLASKTELSIYVEKDSHQ
ncbi:hypothetical protein [Cerasicoccus frondis]|uniref:hypothetical protein n=1 Tax=Cerasicoccus frondis TaxID=490090 RepID=UPI002852BFE7|nr:hypothetical protein [Cerasicoccus frondis]